jgi:hypothetical protein
MSSADDQIQCSQCGATFRNRDLHTTFFQVQKCRSCGFLIEQTEQWGWRNEEAILGEDVDTISIWLDTVAQAAALRVQRVRDRESMGEFLWSVQGLPLPWRCEAVYEQSRPHVLVVRLRAEVSSAEALPDTERLGSACASRGVQPNGSTGSAGHWWAAEQALLTAWVRPALFHPIVDRLAAVLEEVTSRSSAPQGTSSWWMRLARWLKKFPSPFGRR